jgi:hypothetical protein
MTNNKQQSAVEWLQSIELERDLTLADWKQAKEMEKEQHRVTAQDFYYASHSFKNFEQYYNDTYGGGEQ